MRHWDTSAVGERVVRCMDPRSRDRHELQALSSSVDRAVIHVNDLGTLFGIQLHDVVLEQLYSLLLRQNSRKVIKDSLHHCVDPLAQTDLASNLGGVDGVEIEALGGNCALHLVRKVRLELLKCIPLSVQDKGRSRASSLDHVKFAHVGRVPACDVVTTFLDLVLGQVGIWPEPKVGHCHTTAFVGIISEMTLGKKRRVVPDCLDRRLVRANGAIGSQPPE
mmetsp:Transcript_7797/g.19018  ORF Transcript_7797/g.19018 Transcript_7797/m.19018 type:complete len:221 (+) Transcript_7797:2716-3378(+)